MNTTNEKLELYLGGKTYWVCVVSYNSLGESPVATLRIPAIDEKCKYSVNFYLDVWPHLVGQEVIPLLSRVVFLSSQNENEVGTF